MLTYETCSVLEQLKDIIRRGRWLLRSWSGRDVYFRPQVRKQLEFIGGSGGSIFGAWAITPRAIRPDSIVYSIGIGNNIDFDLGMIQRHGVTIYAFDPTPEAHEWLARQHVPDTYRAYTFGVAGIDGMATFQPHENADFVAHSMVRVGSDAGIERPVHRIPTIMEMLGHDRIDLLKMDIEGAEYSVLDDIVTSGVDVRQLLVEFHHRFDELHPEMTARAVRQLNAAGFKIFYVSPRGEEYSFVKE